MSVEITDEDAKVTRLSFASPPDITLCSVSANILFADDHAFLVRTTLKVGGQEWHEHVLYEFDAEPDPAT